MLGGFFFVIERAIHFLGFLFGLMHDFNSTLADAVERPLLCQNKVFITNDVPRNIPALHR